MVGKTLCVWVVLIASVLAGCVDTVNVDKGESLVLNAEKRVVLVKDNFVDPRLPSNPGNGDSKGLGEVGSKSTRLVCAEPSPDALTTLAWSAAASGGFNGQGGSLSGGVSEAATLAARTGATQILRDLGYRACEGLMNGVIGADGYDRIIGGTPPTVLGMVAIEGLTGMRAPDSTTIRSDPPSSTPKDPKELGAAPKDPKDPSPAPKDPKDPSAAPKNPKDPGGALKDKAEKLQTTCESWWA